MIICIRVPDGDAEQSADYVKFIGSQMDEGFTSGHVDSEHYWSIEEEPVSEEPKIHKARPSEGDPYHCAVCRSAVKRVPGGQGPTYIHENTGAVAGPGADEEGL